MRALLAYGVWVIRHPAMAGWIGELMLADGRAVEPSASATAGSVRRRPTMTRATTREMTRNTAEPVSAADTP